MLWYKKTLYKMRPKFQQDVIYLHRLSDSKQYVSFFVNINLTLSRNSMNVLNSCLSVNSVFMNCLFM
jgi:hypothetical protein